MTIVTRDQNSLWLITCSKSALPFKRKVPTKYKAVFARLTPSQWKKKIYIVIHKETGGSGAFSRDNTDHSIFSETEKEELIFRNRFPAWIAFTCKIANKFVELFELNGKWNKKITF